MRSDCHLAHWTVLVRWTIAAADQTFMDKNLSRTSKKIKPASAQFWLLAIFLALVFLTGGASRIDEQSLLLLRPASVLFCVFALLTLHKEHCKGYGWLLAGVAATFALLLLHLTPLPPAIWQSLPGRADVVNTDHIAMLGDVWRPLSLTPTNGLHSMLSLLTPLAVLLLGIQLDRGELFRLLPVLLGLGTLSGILGLLQVISNPDGPLYLYRVTNNGSAVGLFANRNHAAILLACLFPILAVFASASEATADQQRGKQMLSIAIGIVIVPLILVTGSRSGLLIAAVGLAGAAATYRSPPDGRVVRRGQSKFRSIIAPLIGCIFVSCLIFLTFFYSRASAIDRLFQKSSVEDNRGEIWIVGFDMLRSYFPFGSGAGSFVEAYQIFEPSRLLDPTYLNHAHNDWLETGITFGLPGLILLAAATFFFLRRTHYIWRHGNPDRRYVRFGRMAGMLMAMIALASFTDYPLRTPLMMSVMSILVLWFNAANREDNAIGSSRFESKG
jgi:O-Antigen ligase